MVGQKMLMLRQQDTMQAIDSRLKSSTHEYYYIIDLLRIFAVISVILDHVFLGSITGGHLGIDYYFLVVALENKEIHRYSVQLKIYKNTVQSDVYSRI